MVKRKKRKKKKKKNFKIRYLQQLVSFCLSLFSTALSKKVDAIAMKQIVAALSALMLEAAKSNADDAALRAAVAESGASDEQLKVIAASYIANADALRALLARTEFGFSAIGDVDWRLDYYIKSDALDRTNEPVYIVRLHTRRDLDGAQRFVVSRASPAASDAAKAKAKARDLAAASATAAAAPAVAGKNNGDDDDDVIEFACSRLQLQDLVSKLKDAVKQIERTAQV
jgi:hypothetical protein